MCMLGLVVVLTACGGGGGSDASANPPPEATVAALASPGTGEAAASAPVTQGDGSASSTNADTVGMARALGASASVVVAGVAEAPAPAPKVAAAPGGRSYYVDSNTGNDANDGRAAAAGAGGSGPWRTLARVQQSGLTAGDALVLACGSNWRETLRLPASGTAERPIVVSAPAGGCGLAPAIDGGQPLPASGWTRHSGNIYKTTLATAPLQLHSSSGTWTVAHHPNRGSVAGDPASPYLSLPADGNVVTVNGRAVSTQLTTGAELAVPAGQRLAAGARVRVRTNSYVVDEAAIAAAGGGHLTLASPTLYPVKAGWGYLLTGQLWMLDSPGEWFHDAAAQQLYAWLPDSAAPAAGITASVLTIGIDLRSSQYVVIDGLAVRRVGTGVQMRQTKGVQVRNTVFEDVADIGADAAGSTRATLAGNSFARTGADAITGQGSDVGYASGMTVQNNVIRDSGVLMQGEAVLSLPRRTYGAIFSGPGSVVSGNSIVNAGYIGIQVLAGSVVEDNLVYGACSVIDDCGGIYTGGAENNSQIRRNTVVHSRGAVSGKPAGQRDTQAQGIYLDDLTTGVVVEDNTVVDTDNGVLLHVAARNTVRNNRLYGNRTSQIWMQETPTTATPGGQLTDNLIAGNLVAAVAPRSVGLLLQSSYASTAAFGSFDGNRYYDRAAPTVALVSTPAGSRGYTLAQWRQSSLAGSSMPVDGHGTGVSADYAAYATLGGNLVGNSALLTDSAGWSIWNETAPRGQLFREACAAGICLRYVAGGSPGVISSPNFSVQQGRWYRLTLDLATEQDNQDVPLVVRRGGGGGNGYESVSDRDLALTAGHIRGRYSVSFQATKTVIAGDPATGDLGARVDIDGIVAGRSVSLANLEVVAITPDAAAQTSAALVNAGTSPAAQPCPYQASQPALCGKLFNLSDSRPVAWPLNVPAHGAVILYAQEPSLADSDGDGVSDAQDRCPGTGAGVAVNAGGCSYTQR
jgi:parallel beta-helix repeat protein